MVHFDLRCRKQHRSCQGWNNWNPRPICLRQHRLRGITNSSLVHGRDGERVAYERGQTIDCDLATVAEGGHYSCQAVHRLTTSVAEHHRILQATSRGCGRRRDVVSLNNASSIAWRLEHEHSLTVRGHHAHQSGRLQHCGLRPHNGHGIRGVGAGRDGRSRHRHLRRAHRQLYLRTALPRDEPRIQHSSSLCGCLEHRRHGDVLFDEVHIQGVREGASNESGREYACGEGEPCEFRLLCHRCNNGSQDRCVIRHGCRAEEHGCRLRPADRKTSEVKCHGDCFGVRGHRVYDCSRICKTTHGLSRKPRIVGR
mmetsp:Transcript_25071/g.65732  ORF Transcript_25071/g.65732 Transcript_25071/m.65732 type:complete len:311 (-) Transcript_25071:452-1384(-)